MSAIKLTYAQEAMLRKAIRDEGLDYGSIIGGMNTTARKLLEHGLIEWIEPEDGGYSYYRRIRATDAGYAHLRISRDSR